ncbi:T9SS type A sorting domain-containing protein [candidate division KSB1 bacterium]|nr:T9SS type A sorting domain-containing protein [bacterium]NUM67413.1 T9SS type A sorting domain-containing protein [candidate division KSB1 bacterium]
MRTNQLAAQLLVWALLALPAVAVSQIARFEGSDLVLENRFIKVTLAAEQGMITSWLIKATGQELAYFDQAGSKGLLGARIWTGNWDEEGGWPTEVGRATWTNQIVSNSRASALVRQSLALSEGGVATGMKVVKNFLLTQNSYLIAAEYKLINRTDHTIAFTALTLESTANTGSGGRLGYGEHGSNAVTIITQGQVVENFDFQWMAMEVETRDALFGTVFLDHRPAFAWLYEGVGDNGRDMEPHFGPMNLASGGTETFHLLIYGGPGSLDWFSPAASSQNQSLLRMNEAATEKPLRFVLAQNYPNPFNPETEIRFALPEAGSVVLKIFNTLGEEIRTLAAAPFAAGHHRVLWDGKDNDGKPVASGIYLYQLRVGEFVQVRKMSLLR